MKRTQLGLLAIGAFILATIATSFAPAAAQVPYYRKAGNSSGSTVTLTGQAGQGLCTLDLSNSTATFSASYTAGGSNPFNVDFRDNKNADLGATVTAPGVFYFQCANLDSLTITASTGTFTYTVIATGQAWFGRAAGGPSPAPLNCFTNINGTYVCLNTPGPVPSTEPSTLQNGFAALKGIYLDQSGDTGHDAPDNIVMRSSDAAACAAAGFTGHVAWGVGLDTIQNIPGTMMRVGCYGESGLGVAMALDDSGDLGLRGSLSTGAAINLPQGNGINFPSSSSAINNCILRDSDTPSAVLLVHTSGSATCTFALPDLAAGTLCVNSSGQFFTAGCGGGSGGINLQGSFPGTMQTGNGNISGIFGSAGGFEAGYNGTKNGFHAFDGGTNDAGFVFNTFTTADSSQHFATSLNDNNNEGNLDMAGAGPDYIWSHNNSLILDTGNVGSGVLVNFNDGNGQGFFIGDGGKTNFTNIKIGAALGTFTVNFNKGQLTCTISSATSCTATAAVSSANRCPLTYDDAATTAGLLATLALPTEHVSGSTLTVTMNVSTAGSGTLAVDYSCS